MVEFFFTQKMNLSYLIIAFFALFLIILSQPSINNIPVIDFHRRSSVDEGINDINMIQDLGYQQLQLNINNVFFIIFYM